LPKVENLEFIVLGKEIDLKIILALVKSIFFFLRNECSAQVNKFPNSIYKKFATENEAQNFIKERSSSSIEISYTKQKLISTVIKSVE